MSRFRAFPSILGGIGGTAVSFISTFGAISRLTGQTIAATFSRPLELRETVRYVMSIADQYDDRIQARWGGKRAIDVAAKAAPPHRRQLRVKLHTGAEQLDETFLMNPEDLQPK